MAQVALPEPSEKNMPKMLRPTHRRQIKAQPNEKASEFVGTLVLVSPTLLLLALGMNRG